MSEYLGVLRRIAASTKVSASIGAQQPFFSLQSIAAEALTSSCLLLSVEGLVPAIAISLLMVLAVVLVNLSSRLSGAISHTRRRMVRLAFFDSPLGSEAPRQRLTLSRSSLAMRSSRSPTKQSAPSCSSSAEHGSSSQRPS